RHYSPLLMFQRHQMFLFLPFARPHATPPLSGRRSSAPTAPTPRALLPCPADRPPPQPHRVHDPWHPPPPTVPTAVPRCDVPAADRPQHRFFVPLLSLGHGSIIGNATDSSSPHHRPPDLVSFLSIPLHSPTDRLSTAACATGLPGERGR